MTSLKAALILIAICIALLGLMVSPSEAARWRTTSTTTTPAPEPTRRTRASRGTTTTTQPPINFVCPTAFGNFAPKKQTCPTFFYMCSNGVPYYFNCPDGLAFNTAKLGFCDWKENVKGC